MKTMCGIVYVYSGDLEKGEELTRPLREFGPPAFALGHPAPYPLALAERLIRMFSFVGDTVLDPFVGTGTTNVASARSGRHSHGIELDPSYFEQAHRRLSSEPSVLSGLATIELLRGA